MIIEVSQLPPSSANPNARVHWAKRYKDNQTYSGAVYYEAVQVRNSLAAGGDFRPFRRPVLQLTFVFPYEQKHDEDNLRAKFKAGQDALVHAGIILEDNMSQLVVKRPNILVDPQRAPMTIIDIREGRNAKTGNDKETC